MVSIQQIYRTMHQKLRNLLCQTGNFVAQQSCGTKLCNFVTCLTWALVTMHWEQKITASTTRQEKCQ